MIGQSLIKSRCLALLPSAARKLCTSSQTDMGRLSGKVAVVTASTEGIGFACAQRLGREGAHVLISSRKQKNVDQALEVLQSEGLSVKGMVCHVANPEHRQKLVETAIQEFGGIDILVSNAAASPHFGNMLTITEEQWDKLFDTNVKASYMIARDCVPSMRERGGGSIVFVTSIAGYNPFPLLAPYSVTKTALLGLTTAMSGALSPENIRVNAVAPGIIKTRFSESLWKGNEEAPPDTPGIHIPMARYGTPEEVAGVISFLVSPDASYVTGETVVCSGGMQSRL